MGEKTKAIIVREKNELNNINKLLTSPIFKNIDNLVNYDTLGSPIKTSVEKRLKNSKFAQLIKEIPDFELQIIALIMGFSSKGMSIIKMYLNAENTRIQRYALKNEIKGRKNE